MQQLKQVSNGEVYEDTSRWMQNNITGIRDIDCDKKGKAHSSSMIVAIYQVSKQVGFTVQEITGVSQMLGVLQGDRLEYSQA